MRVLALLQVAALYAVFEGCGEAPAHQSSPPQTNSQTPATPATPAPAALPERGFAGAMVAEQLPACDTAGLLVYVPTKQQFSYCNSDGSWTQLDLKGAKGDEGPRGVAGQAGARGVDGAAGVAGPVGAAGSNGLAGPAGAQGVPGVAGPTGPKGDAGTDGVSAADTQWYDPVAKQWWTTSTIGTAVFADALAACTSGWALPTQLQWTLAKLRGVPVNNTVWYADGTGGQLVYCVEVL